LADPETSDHDGDARAGFFGSRAAIDPNRPGAVGTDLGKQPVSGMFDKPGIGGGFEPHRDLRHSNDHGTRGGFARRSDHGDPRRTLHVLRVPARALRTRDRGQGSRDFTDHDGRDADGFARTAVEGDEPDEAGRPDGTENSQNEPHPPE
jgi:hypothetical protein